MKIVDNTTPLTCSFDDLPPLAVFKFDGNLYMKLPRTLFADPYEDADEVDTISLTTGEAVYFCYSEPVYRLEATLTIQPFIPPSC